MTEHITGTREEWLAARLELLEARRYLRRRASSSSAVPYRRFAAPSLRTPDAGQAPGHVDREIGLVIGTRIGTSTEPPCFHSWSLAALGAADWLSLAAAPTFAIMALLAGVLGGAPPDMFCSAAQSASPLTGMVPMYLLMSAFHSAPWLKLFSPAGEAVPTGPDPAFAARQASQQTGG